jgi:universal stress protein E
VLRHKPSLLIAQSTRKSPIARAASTRSDYKLIETCPCPVLFIKTQRSYSDALLVATVDPEQSHGKPQSLDDEILGLAKKVRDALSARLRVFHARTQREGALEIASDVLELARRHAIPDEQVQIEEGYPAAALPRFLSREAADIVIIGGAARSRLRRALIGHTAEKVLDALDCDVLVVKPSQFCSPVSRQSTHHVESSGGRRARYIW